MLLYPFLYCALDIMILLDFIDLEASLAISAIPIH